MRNEDYRSGDLFAKSTLVESPLSGYTNLMIFTPRVAKIKIQCFSMIRYIALSCRSKELHDIRIVAPLHHLYQYFHSLPTRHWTLTVIILARVKSLASRSRGHKTPSFVHVRYLFPPSPCTKTMSTMVSRSLAFSRGESVSYGDNNI